MPSDYRSSKNYKEIIGVMVESQKVGGSFLWQHVGEKRVTYDIKVSSLDPVIQKIEIEVLANEKNLATDEPCFVKIPIKECAFKTMILKQNGKTLLLDFPFEMVLSENRDSSRVFFRENAQKHATFKSKNSSDPVFGGTGIVLDVLNVSKTGICVYVNQANASKFNVGDKITMLSLSGMKMNPSQEVEIVRNTEYERRGSLRSVETGYQIGIKFSVFLEQDVFDEFTFVDAPVMFNDQRFLKDQAYREAVKAGMSKTLNRIMEKQHLKNLFQKLNIKRGENAYLKNHIELLCEVLSHIGKGIGWVSETNLDKLIYVAYMHDIRYFDQPYLARIKDKRDLEFKKKSLKPGDDKIFLEGPAYAAALAQEDINNHPDAPKILMQHRELPNGSGFPAGIKGSQLSPLTCLFMVCHEFVDYIIEDPEWTYEDFLRRYRRVFTGTYFHKIFQVFESLC